MEIFSLEALHAQTNNSHLQHYSSTLNGSVSPEEAVFLKEEVALTLNLHSKVVSIIQKDDRCGGFLVNYYVCPR
jgi:hypothetical protein